MRTRSLQPASTMLTHKNSSKMMSIIVQKWSNNNVIYAFCTQCLVFGCFFYAQYLFFLLSFKSQTHYSPWMMSWVFLSDMAVHFDSFAYASQLFRLLLIILVLFFIAYSISLIRYAHINSLSIAFFSFSLKILLTTWKHCCVSHFIEIF